MASTVKTKQFAGGKGVNVPDKDDGDLATILRDMIDDISDLRAKYALAVAEIAQLTAKLDADSGVGDTNYAAQIVFPALATQNCTKG